MGGREGLGIAVDPAGNAYVTGDTNDPGFLLANPMQNTLKGLPNNGSAFVTKLNPTGTNLVYSTFLGGSNGDTGRAIAVDANGDAWVTGVTLSNDFPTVAPVQAIPAKAPEFENAFIAEVNPQGSALLFSTYLKQQRLRGRTRHRRGYLWWQRICRRTTNSPNFPTTAGAFNTSVANGDLYVVKLNLMPTITSVGTSSGGPNIAQNTWIEVHGSNLAIPPGRIWDSSDIPTACCRRPSIMSVLPSTTNPLSCTS